MGKRRPAPPRVFSLALSLVSLSRFSLASQPTTRPTDDCLRAFSPVSSTASLCQWRGARGRAAAESLNQSSNRPQFSCRRPAPKLAVVRLLSRAPSCCRTLAVPVPLAVVRLLSPPPSVLRLSLSVLTRVALRRGYFSPSFAITSCVITVLGTTHSTVSVAFE